MGTEAVKTEEIKMKHTPGPWAYVPSTEHHGPYVTSDYGNTICDCYVMSNPTALSTRNGGTSRPISFMHEMADPNARLIAAAPEMAEALRPFACYALALDEGEAAFTVRAEELAAALEVLRKAGVLE